MRIFVLAFLLTAPVCLLNAQRGGGRGQGGRPSGGTAANGVIPALPLTAPDPEYVPAARDAGVEGDVLVSLVVDDKGHPKNMKVTKKLGHGLDEKALEAVKKWTFAPGTRNGMPVESKLTVAVPFRIAK